MTYAWSRESRSILKELIDQHQLIEVILGVIKKRLLATSTGAPDDETLLSALLGIIRFIITNDVCDVCLSAEQVQCLWISTVDRLDYTPAAKAVAFNFFREALIGMRAMKGMVILDFQLS